MADGRAVENFVSLFGSRRNSSLKTVVAAVMISCGFLLSSPHRPNAAMTTISIEELARSSDLVAIGKVVDIESYWDGNLIKSKVTFEVSRVIVGSLDGRQTIQVEIVGGTVGDVGLRSSNQPFPERCDEVLLFLKAANQNVFTINGLSQGYLQIVQGAVPARGVPVDTVVNAIQSRK